MVASSAPLRICRSGFRSSDRIVSSDAESLFIASAFSSAIRWWTNSAWFVCGCTTIVAGGATGSLATTVGFGSGGVGEFDEGLAVARAGVSGEVNRLAIFESKASAPANPTATNNTEMTTFSLTLPHQNVCAVPLAEKLPDNTAFSVASEYIEPVPPAALMVNDCELFTIPVFLLAAELFIVLMK